MIATAAGADSKGLNRLGGMSAIALGIGYVAIFPLYAYTGAPPVGGEEWLKYAAGKTAAWWGILGLSVLTDFLFVPIALALYHALKELNRNLMQLATAFVASFVALDLAVTWSNFAALIRLSDRYAAATTDAQRAAYVAAANYASAVVTSPLESVYAILTLAVGILLVGLVMLRSTFGKPAAYLGLATGIAGTIAVVGPLVVSSLSLFVIIAAVLTTLWVFAVGYELLTLRER